MLHQQNGLCMPTQCIELLITKKADEKIICQESVSCMEQIVSN